MRRFGMAAFAALLVPGCDGAPPAMDEERTAADSIQRDIPESVQTDAQAVFWASLQELCGTAHSGRVVEAPADDTTFAGKDLRTLL